MQWEDLSLSSSDKESHLPNARQTLLATLTGISIGLVLTHYLQHPSPLRANANFGATGASQKLIASQTVGGNTLSASSQTGQSAPGASAQKSLLDFSDFNLWPKLDQRMNLLLMGVDSNGRDTERFKGCRSDTMMIASLDPVNHKVALISLPRDSRVRLADNHGVDKINAAHALGGPELAVKTVSEDFAVHIDHYVVIDVQGLKKVFEVLGPVDVLVEKPMHYRDHAGRLNIALEPGVVSMDAAKLEEYVRFRHDAKGDIGRIERQQWFMRQVKKKLEEPQVLLKLPELFKLASDYVRTDLSMEEMAKLASFSKDIKPGEIETAMLPGVGTTIYGGSYWLPDPESAAIVLHRLLGAPLAAGTIAGNTGSSIRNVVMSKAATAVGEVSPIDSISAVNDNLNATLAASYSDKPLSVIVRYPKGGEELAQALETRLNARGLSVKYRTRGESSECAHEQIIQTSYRADDDMTAKLKGAVTELSPFAVSVNLDPKAITDFIVVLSSTSVIAPPEPSVANSDVQNSAAPPGSGSKRDCILSR